MPPDDFLRIAQVAPVTLPVPPVDEGGTERIIADLCDALMAMGHQVTLFAANDSRSQAPRIGTLPSLNALERRHGKVPPGLPGVLESALLEQLRRCLDDFDIIHCHGEFFHAALLGTHRPRSLTTIHWRTDELDRQLFFASFPDLPVAAISDAQARGIPDSNLRGRVYHGLPEQRFTPNGPPGQDLLFIGRMTDQKRPDRAIAIACMAHRKLRLAGSIDPGNPYYFEHHVAPRLADDIIHVGAIDDSRKQELLAGAAALLFPIDWPEPFGLVMIEAMACGTPVIAWPGGAVEEVVEDGVTGFIVDTVEAASAAVQRLPTLDRAAIRARFVERFTARRMAADYTDLYRRLLAATPQGSPR